MTPIQPGRRRSGMTLLEVTIAAMILSVVIALALDSARRSIRTSGTGTATATLRRNARDAVDLLTRQLQTCPPQRYRHDPGGGWAALPANTKVNKLGYQVCVGIDTSPLGLTPPQVPRPIYEPGASVRVVRLDTSRRELKLALTDGAAEITLASFVDTFEFFLDPVTGNGNLRIVMSVVDPAGRLDANKNPERITVEYGRFFLPHNSEAN